MIVHTILATVEDQAIASVISDYVAQSFPPKIVSSQYMRRDWKSRVGLPRLRTYIMTIIIGPEWSSAIIQPHNQRIRQDIALLLQKNVPIILTLPVIVQNASAPAASELPPDLQPLMQLQALVVRETPQSAQDVKAVVERIQQFEKTVEQLQTTRDNFPTFKILSFAPFSTVAVFGAISIALHISVTDDITSVIPYLFISSTLMSLIVLWPMATAIALVTRRRRWAIVNGIVPPASLALVALWPLIQQLPSIWQTILSGSLVTYWILVFFILPVIFGLTLPPHRRKKIQAEG